MKEFLIGSILVTSLFLVGYQSVAQDCYTIDTSRPEWLGVGVGIFIRADANADSEILMSDAIYTLKYLYVPGSDPPPCMKAADSNDDGVVFMSDAIYTLKYLYVPGSPPPPLPCCDYPSDCGTDPTADALDCESHPCMGGVKVAAKPIESGGKLILGEVQVVGNRAIVPVHLTNTVPLAGFAYTVRYDPEFLSFQEAVKGVTTRDFDFFSARPDDELGEVTVGCVASFTLSEQLNPGKHHVGELIFELERKLDKDILLKLKDVELVDTEAESFTAELKNGVIKSEQRLRRIKPR